jgi:acyl phosphate:glycerol-3-phosphate acyltransferase
VTGFAWLDLGLFFAAAYLAGSLSFGVVLTRLLGQGDLRARGSGNAGTLNAARVLGKGWALLVLALDAGRGALAAWLALRLLPGPWMPYLGLAGVLVGNLVPLFHGFQGGKGVATTLGIMLGLDWVVGLGGPGVWLALALSTGWGSLGSLGMALAFPVLLLLRGHAWPAVALGAALTAVLLVTHRANLARMLRGEEPKLTRGRAA